MCYIDLCKPHGVMGDDSQWCNHKLLENTYHDTSDHNELLYIKHMLIVKI